MNLAKVSSNGQITVPIEIRRKLGLKSGDKTQNIHTTTQKSCQPLEYLLYKNFYRTLIRYASNFYKAPIYKSYIDFHALV